MEVPVVFSSRFKVAFVSTWKVSCGELWDSASRDAQTLNLSRNVSNSYAWQVVSLMNEQHRQNLWLAVDPLSTICNNKLIARVKNPTHQLIVVSNISSLLLKRRYTRYWVFFSHFSLPLEHSATYSVSFVVRIRSTACVKRKFEGVYI